MPVMLRYTSEFKEQCVRLVFSEIGPEESRKAALIGGVTGLFGARLVWGALAGVDIVGDQFVHVFIVVFLGYMGIVIGGQKGEWFEPARIIAAFKDSSRLHQYKVLDTSVIIDGRIADICETGFLDGTLGSFVDALETIGDTNVIASPRLTCLNNLH